LIDFKNGEEKLNFSHRVQDIIRNRTSVRTYQKRPLELADVTKIRTLLYELNRGPMGSSVRFELVAAKDGDTDALKGFGTYGFIRHPAGFIVGAAQPSSSEMVDFGYLMQSVVLTLTDMGLGTCWLGGTFRKSRFAKSIVLCKDEIIPAVVSVGYPAERRRPLDQIVRFAAGSEKRKSWEKLFFSSDFKTPLQPDSRNPYSQVLEMLRLAPSASNRQPWRIVYNSDYMLYHFFLKRTRGYRPHKIGLADLQRVDIGIAMSHFALASEAFGLKGSWIRDVPEFTDLPLFTEYIITWKSVSWRSGK
jgi:nitroreductase